MTKQFSSSDIPSYCTFVGRNNSEKSYVVLGNCVDDEDDTIWCADWATGAKENLPLSELRSISAPADCSGVVSRVEDWAAAGREHAMFWLGWWFEGTNHPRSVWYYMAAISKAPSNYGWLLSRVHSDAYYSATCRDVALPDLGFLAHIKEFRQARSNCNRVELGDWTEALQKAQTAVHRAWGFPATARRLHVTWPWLPEDARSTAREGVDICGDTEVWISAHVDGYSCEYDDPTGPDAYVITVRHQPWLAFKSLVDAQAYFLDCQLSDFSDQLNWAESFQPVSVYFSHS